MSEILKDLQGQIAERRAVLVVGTGVSVAASGREPVASWVGLLEHGVVRCLEVGASIPDGWKERRLGDIRSGDIGKMISAAGQIRESLGGVESAEYRRWLRDTVGSLTPKDRGVLEAIRDLGLPLATTNYDGLLEEVTGWPAVTWREPERALQILRGEEKAVLHFHGFWFEPASVVLGAGTYEQVLGDVRANALLQMLGLLESLVFVGFEGGLRDPNFGALVEWLRKHGSGLDHRHYRLCLESDLAELRRAHRLDRTSPLSYGTNLADLASFLHELRRSSIGKDISPEEPGATHAQVSSRPRSTQTNLPGLVDSPGNPTSAASSPLAKGPRVFLSYSHDSREHQDQVLALADRLREEGVDARLDQYEVSPPEGWPRWMKREIRDAAFVLVVCTETYRRRFDGEEVPGKGKGVSWEGAILTQEMYEDQGRNTRFIPIIFSLTEEAHIPTELKGGTRYVLASKSGYDDLYRHLTAQQTVPMPELGRLRELPPRDRRTSFLGEPLAPEPLHRDDRDRELHTNLARLQEQYDELLATGGDPAATRAELLEVKRKIRSGGQLKAGEHLGSGRYRLLEVIGSGGFAIVWKAWDRRTRRHVALKVLHPQYAYDATRRERFFRGARQMARLDHPGIVRVLAEELEDEGYHFFVMEYLPGGDLRQAVLRGNLTSESALQVVQIVGEALHYAHQRGIVHRDIKPANILLDDSARPRLTDFDLVRAFDTTGGTKTSTQLGTFLYAAPEAMSEGKGADAAADQYSLAMTLCFAVLGKDLPPTAIFDLAGFRRNLPCDERLKEVLARATALEPGERFADMKALLDALCQARSEASTPATVVPRPGPLATGSKNDATALLEHLAKGQPGERLAALAHLRDEHQAKIRREDLLKKLPTGEELRNILETGAAELPEEERNSRLLVVIDGLLPRLQEDLDTLGLAAWVLDYFPGRSPSAAERARAAKFRHDLFQPLRKQHSPPDSAVGWARIPAGTFVMGSPSGEGSVDERPAHTVTLSAFRFQTHPVTNWQLRLLQPEHTGEDMLPAVGVSWNLAYAYSTWLGGRLPTEAEWEYAARAGCPHPYCDRHGNATTLAKVGWYGANSGRVLHPVGRKEPNPWGLYDLYGNTWEWTADWYAPYSAGDQADPWGPPLGEQRVVRGGSAWNDAFRVCAAFRNLRNPRNWDENQGFRVVLPAVPEP